MPSIRSVSSEEVNTEETPQVKRLVQLLTERFENRVTLLAVCPNSEAAVQAALLASKEANAPILLAATLNQVDLDGGYTGWTPEHLREFVLVEAGRIGLESPTLLCLDHGGPWLKDRHARDGLDLEDAMRAVKSSIEACIDAGYGLLHIDPTIDRTLPEGVPIPIDWVVERTLDLIEHAESYRARNGAPPVSYEVGTEEVHGGLADLSNFEAFLTGLDRGLRERDLEHAWPTFVVGKVGTDLDTSYFDPEMARLLTERVKPLGALIKGHYTDGVDNPEEYPLTGMGAANVGPEFTEEEYRALMDLASFERKLGLDSGIEETLRDAVISSNRWQKWLQPDERSAAFAGLNPERQRWLIRTGCRYIWADSDVRSARRRLYENLAGLRNAHAFVLWRIKTAIMKYYHAFNLIDFNIRVID